MEGGVVEDVQGGVSLQMRDVQEHRVEEMQEVDVIGDASVLRVADRSYLLPLASPLAPVPPPRPVSIVENRSTEL